MSESNKDENVNKEDNKSKTVDEASDQKVEISIEEKLKKSEEKLLRALADSENQRRRFEKEVKDAFEFGGFNFAREILTTLDNVQRAKKSIQEDEILKKSEEFEKFLKNIEIIEKDLVSTFEKNKITKIHFRSFANRKSCWKFKNILRFKFNKFSDKKLTIRTNVRGTKIQYFYGDNKWVTK